MSNSPQQDDNAENCDELNDDYFSTICQTFSIVDTWEEKDESDIKKEPNNEDSNHSNSNSSSKRAAIKKSNSHSSSSKERPKSRDEPRIARTNSTSQAERNRSRERSSAERRRISQERKRISPPRNRSPVRARSPIRFQNDRFRRSPPRTFDRRPVSPVRNNRNDRKAAGSSAAKPFLEEIKEVFAKKGIVDQGVENMLRKGVKIDYKKIAHEKPSPKRNIQNNQGNFNNPNQFNQMQTMPMMMMNPMPFGFMGSVDVYGNVMPQMMNMEIPQPVPPPHVDLMNMQQAPKPVSPPVRKQPVTIIRENVDEPPPKKTATEAEAPNLLEILRQKSKKNIKSSSDEIASKKAKVLEKCREAVNLIDNLQQNRSKVPFAFALSEELLHKQMDTHNRSPLLANESNPQFLYHSSPEQIRSALKNHPLRNIYGSTLELAQHLKFDLYELSLNVERDAFLDQENSKKAEIPPPPTNIVKVQQQPVQKNVIKKVATKSQGIQTENLVCKKCVARENTKKSARNQACQTEVKQEDADIQVNIDKKEEDSVLDEDGSFRIVIDAQTMRDRNFEQHHALEVLSKAFSIPCNLFDKKIEPIEPPRFVQTQDDLVAYLNPENPHRNPENPNNKPFFSLSPIRSVQRSNSPRRVRPYIFDRIGEKVSDHSDSPQYEDRFGLNQPIRPYTIPSPEFVVRRHSPMDEFAARRRNSPSPDYVARRRNSPSPASSRRFRNRSFSNSRSRSHSRSPKRSRTGYKVLDRRGRY